jgi:hypothetical protein
MLPRWTCPIGNLDYQFTSFGHHWALVSERSRYEPKCAGSERCSYVPPQKRYRRAREQGGKRNSRSTTCRSNRDDKPAPGGQVIKPKSRTKTIRTSRSPKLKNDAFYAPNVAWSPCQAAAQRHARHTRVHRGQRHGAAPGRRKDPHRQAGCVSRTTIDRAHRTGSLQINLHDHPPARCLPPLRLDLDEAALHELAAL